MTEEERKTATGHGMVHSLVKISNAIQRERGILRNDIPSRYVRKRKPHQDRLAALTEVSDVIKHELRELRTVTA